MNDPEVQKVLHRWLRYAEDDLRTAELLLEHDGVPRNACFQAQQAAEKAIKAIFVFLQEDFPFTHNLDRLRDLLPEGWDVKEGFPDLAGLSKWAAEPRYPGDVIEATRQDAETAVEQARGILETTLEDLKRRGYVTPSYDGTEQESERNRG